MPNDLHCLNCGAWYDIRTYHRCGEPQPPSPIIIDLVAHVHRQRRFSQRTFGPGARVGMVIGHIRKELEEILHNPSDLTEWIDVVLLALDGAWRQGYSPEEIAQALVEKQAVNERRKWPDWRGRSDNEPIEHVP